MANVLVEQTSIEAIANAIRERNGTEETYTPAEMAPAIQAISAGGSSKKLLQGSITNAKTYATNTIIFPSLEIISKMKKIYFCDQVNGLSVFYDTDICPLWENEDYIILPMNALANNYPPSNTQSYSLGYSYYKDSETGVWSKGIGIYRIKITKSTLSGIFQATKSITNLSNDTAWSTYDNYIMYGSSTAPYWYEE